MGNRKCHGDAEGLDDVDSDDDNYDDEETNGMRFHGLIETYALIIIITHANTRGLHINIMSVI